MISNRDWYYLQQQRKRRREQDTPEQRYFRTNSGTTDYVQLGSEIPIGLGTRVQIDVKMATGTTTAFLLTDKTGNSFRVIRYQGELWVQFSSDSSKINRFTCPELNDALHRVAFNVSGTGTVAASLDGASLNKTVSYTVTDSVVMNAFASKWDTSTSLPNLSGVIANIIVEQAGTLTNSWAIDDNSNTIIDSVGGNNGTIINGNPGDWELYTKVGNTWVGTVSGEVIPIAY